MDWTCALRTGIIQGNRLQVSGFRKKASAAENLSPVTCHLSSGQFRVKPPTYLHSPVYEIGPVMPPRFTAKGFADPIDTLHSLEEATHYCGQGHIPFRHHVPEHIGKVVGPPAELVGVIENIGKELAIRIVQRNCRMEGFVVCNGAGNGRALTAVEIEIPKKPICLFGPFPGMVPLSSFDIVKNPGHMRQQDDSPNRLGRVGPLTLNEDEGSRIDGHLCDMAQSVARPFRVGPNDSDGLFHERMLPEQKRRRFHRLPLLAVKKRISYFPGDSPGDRLCIPVFLSHIQDLLSTGFSSLR